MSTGLSGETNIQLGNMLPPMTEYKAVVPDIPEKTAAKPDLRALIEKYMVRTEGMKAMLKSMTAYEELPPGKWAEIRAQFLQQLDESASGEQSESPSAEANLPISAQLKKAIAENSNQDDIAEILGGGESGLDTAPMVNLLRMREQFSDNPQVKGWFSQLDQYAERAGQILQAHKEVQQEVQNALKNPDSTQQMIDKIRADFNEKYGEGEPPAGSADRAKYEKDKEMKDKMEAAGHGSDHSLLGEIFHYFISEMKGISQL